MNLRATTFFPIAAMKIGRWMAIAIFLAGCAAATDTESVRAEIEAAIERNLEATKNQDIEAYMAGFPDDGVIFDESGEVVTKAMQREYALRDWSIIPETLAIEAEIDDIEVDGDSAVVYTSQRWERLMLRRDGVTTDTVLTTQKHRELWRRTPSGWLPYEIEELGGEIFVNGEPYEP